MGATDLDALVARLRDLGVVPVAADVTIAALTGGVSSDVHRMAWPGGSLVAKQALSRLRVAADWEAPPRRSANEVRWLRTAAAIAPAAVPAVLAEDPAAHMFAMEDLTGAPVWKAELAAGRCDPAFAAQVGAVAAAIHSGTACRPEVEAAFRDDSLFRALRVEPYLGAAAAANQDVSEVLATLSDALLATRCTLVHGDLSPKNLLVTAHGPVILDAETAWWGDPAFDLAFATTHLLLKARWHPEHAAEYAACRTALADAYLDGVDWEAPGDVDRRAAGLVPALLLARVDGKSPVEYLDGAARDATRTFALHALLEEAFPSTGSVAQAWYGT